MSPENDPLLADPPAEVPLPSAPLVRVIAQARFSSILAVQQPEFIAPFQEAIRKLYPVLRRESAQHFDLGPHGVATGRNRTTWRFCDTDDEWRVSLAEEFVALETTGYENREDFLARFERIIHEVREHFDPALVQRLGLRYIDRLEGNDLDGIHEMVRREMLGISVTSLSSHVQLAMSETLLQLPESQDRLRMRWGRLPAHATIDPDAIEAIDRPSWVLDLDMFSTEELPFATDAIVARMRQYAERIYTMFRWVATDEFLHRYGGQP